MVGNYETLVPPVAEERVAGPSSKCPYDVGVDPDGKEMRSAAYSEGMACGDGEVIC